MPFFSNLTDEFLKILFAGLQDEIIMENDSIFEKNISEHLFTRMKPRIDEFKTWLYDRKENFIVVVGHSAFFRDMLNNSVKMDNCEVKKCSLFAYQHCSGSYRDMVRMIGIKDQGTVYQGGQILLDDSGSL